MNSTNRYLRNLLVPLLTAILLAVWGTDTADAPEADTRKFRNPSG